MWVPPFSYPRTGLSAHQSKLNRVSPCRCGQESSSGEQQAGEFGLKSLESGISLEATYPHSRTHRLTELEGP